MISLKQLENFMRLLHAVQNVQRIARIPDETKLRNTAEHTFELTMVCWYLNNANNLKLNTEKILMYSLAHDLIEAYAGDTYVYDEEGKKDKQKREQEALEKLKDNFQEFPELIQTIENYEERKDAESNFVYATDKLVDPLNISMERKSSFPKEKGVRYSQMRKYKDPKIAQSEHIVPYWKEVCKKFEANKDFFFVKDDE